MDKRLTMQRITNILIAVDGSDSSKNALKRTIEYSKKGDCRITVMTVPPSYEGELELGLVKNIKGIFRDFAEKILSDASEIAKEEGIQIETVLGEGGIHEAIIDVAEAKDCDLIIMGRRGLDNLERAFMGSVTARVIGYSPIDVLVMPHDSTIRCERILLAVDGSKHSELAARRAIQVAQAYNGELKVLSVVDIPIEAYGDALGVVEQMVEKARQMTKNVEEQAKRSGIKAETFVREGDSHEKIIEMAYKLKADVVFMGSHGRTGLRRLLMGSVTEKVIGNAPCPVLVVKAY
ncbi:MAG: universal stress protein [Candidatus Aquicultor sp.]